VQGPPRVERAEGVRGKRRVFEAIFPRTKEDSCRRNGIGRVTAEELEKIRARMPTPKIFG
jgi:hypothetical protein